jgi:L-ascorbate metabolism protein UlaG (beta-lactamase superfamily)
MVDVGGALRATMCAIDTLLALVVGTAVAASGCGTTPAPEHPHTAAEKGDAATLSYLGVAGWKLEAGGRVLLFDPYFTRIDLDALPKDRAIEPDRAAIERWAPKRADLILISHSHYDHLMDAPAIAAATGALVVGTDSTVRVARAAGLPDRQVVVAHGGETFDWPLFDVRAIPALHSLIGMPSVPIAQNVTLPMPASAWNEGGTLQYLVKSAGHSVFFMGTANFVEAQLEGTHPDVAIVAVGLRDKIPDYTCRLMRALGRPKLVLPNHFDSHRTPLGERPPTLGVETREDLAHFADEVRACSPATRVAVPAYFEPISI